LANGITTFELTQPNWTYINLRQTYRQTTA